MTAWFMPMGLCSASSDFQFQYFMKYNTSKGYKVGAEKKVNHVSSG